MLRRNRQLRLAAALAVLIGTVVSATACPRLRSHGDPEPIVFRDLGFRGRSGDPAGVGRASLRRGRTAARGRAERECLPHNRQDVWRRLKPSA